ncbi:MAG TPA: ATP-binding protein [Terracidiphilus sp.]|jgi:signal transduction histidine kinase|nr:ATP-binding protein [Terracidiphilus sp.]
MKTRSLIARATVTVLVIELSCAVGLTSLAVWHERGVRIRGLDATLAGRSDSLVGAVQDAEDPQDNVKVDPDEFATPAGDEYAVYNPDGSLVGTSHGDISAVALGEQDGTRNFSAGKHDYRVLQRKALRIIDREETGGIGLRRPVTVVYAIRSDHVWHEVLEAVRFYVLLSLVAVGVTAVLLILLAKRLLQPLNELASAASSIEPAKLHFVAPVSALSTKELRSLAETLAAAVDRLREAFDAEKRFISDAAHELKTAVAVARSSIQLLGMRTRSAEEYREGLDRILEDNERVEDLVASMLTLARSDEPGLPCEELVDACEETERALRLLAPYAESKGILLLCDNQSHDAKVRMRGDALATVVSNLVMNAVQHSPRGSEVTIRMRRDNSSATLEVEDHGEGIASENLPHVFRRFFREDPSRSRETGGTGLGLSICKSIVESAGGTISIESQKDSGTRVTVRLNLMQPAEDQI